ncbi:hypothetical protein [Paludisphaera sp.]|uniref:golvesin C-terminal-like domain-containing protein n=1 Tax=Paludisphaera sp. TaxID=2017432 RepID=UPI00301E34B7
MEGTGWEGTVSSAPSGDGSSKATWTFNNLPTGVYQVWANWIQAPTMATNSPFTVYNGTSPLATVHMDQTRAPLGYYDGGSSWNTLGERFTIDSGTLKVVLSNDATPGAHVGADAIRIRKVGPWIGDNAQTVAQGFSKTGTWTTWTGLGHGGSIATAVGGDGSTTATWTFPGLAPGKYQVWAHWAQAPTMATNSPFTVYDGGTSRDTLNVDQTQAPTGVYAGGLSWKSLFENVTIDGGTLVLKLTNAGVSSSRSIQADAIRIQRVGPYFVDDTDGTTIFDRTGTWSTWSGGAGYSNTFLSAAAADGPSTATWTFKDLVPGIYEVWASWIQAPSLATNSPFAIYNGSTLLNTVPVNQTLAPSAYFEGPYSYATLGQAYLVDSGTLRVQLSTTGVAAGKHIGADVIRINRVGNPSGGVVVPFSAPTSPLAEVSGPPEASTEEAAAAAFDPVAEAAASPRRSPWARETTGRERIRFAPVAASRPFRAWGDPGRHMRRAPAGSTVV